MRLTEVLKITEIEYKKIPRTLEKDEYHKTLILATSKRFKVITIEIEDYFYSSDDLQEFLNKTQLDEKYETDLEIDEFTLNKKKSKLTAKARVKDFTLYKPKPTELFGEEDQDNE